MFLSALISVIVLICLMTVTSGSGGHVFSPRREVLRSGARGETVRVQLYYFAIGAAKRGCSLEGRKRREKGVTCCQNSPLGGTTVKPLVAARGWDERRRVLGGFIFSVTAIEISAAADGYMCRKKVTRRLQNHLFLCSDDVKIVWRLMLGMVVGIVIDWISTHACRYSEIHWVLIHDWYWCYFFTE